MKWLFVIFLAANLLVFGLLQLDEHSRESTYQNREKNADRLIVVTGQKSTPTPVPVTEASEVAVAEESAAAPAQVASDVAAIAASAVAASATTAPTAEKPEKPRAQACLRWSGFSIEQAKVARSRLNGLAITAIEKGGTEGAKVWVYIPTQDTLDIARSKAQEIIDLGVEDYFVVNNGGKWQNAISLGVYSTREAAERRLAELKEKGVRSAIVRDKDDTLKPVTFILSDVSDSARSQLDKLSKLYRGIELRETKCP